MGGNLSLDSSSVKLSPRVGAGGMASLAWGFGGKSLVALGHRGSMAFLLPASERVEQLEGRQVRFAESSRRLLTFDNHNIWAWSGLTYSILAFNRYADSIMAVEWSPNGKRIAVALSDGGIEILDGETLSAISTNFIEPSHPFPLMWWGPGKLLSAYRESGLAVWDVNDLGFESSNFLSTPHDGYSITGIAQLRDGLATSGEDGTLRIWDKNLKPLSVFESPHGHSLESLSVGHVGGREYLATPDEVGDLHIFCWDTRRLIASLNAAVEPDPGTSFAGFSPDHSLFAARSGRNSARVWRVEELVSADVEPDSSQYRNAKVVLVGDSGVGKSGLAFPLSGRIFEATESTHGRQVWSADRAEVILDDGRKEVRETLLWDLAGQPGYRLFHRLSLRDVAIGLVVFDSRSESDPFRGVMYWARALDEATASQGKVVKLLVSARNDRGGVRVSDERIAEFLKRAGFTAYFETSAKMNDGLPELQTAIVELINWANIPAVVAPHIFVEIRDFLIRQKESGVLLSSELELLQAFEGSLQGPVDEQIFHVCLQRIEAAGLVSRASAGNVWLLQPELLDNYAAWLSQAARTEPDGLGAISESRALEGDYQHEPLPKLVDEKLMLLTAVQEVVGRGLAIRVDTEKGQVLVFPSELRTDLPDYPGTYDREIAFTFSGPVSAIYAALTVRLVNSLSYGNRYSLYRNAALFRAGNRDVVYGFAAQYTKLDDDSEGTIVVFFGGVTSSERKLAFIRYIDYQLRQMAIEGSIVRSRLYSCCGEKIPEVAVSKRRDKGERTVICAICGGHQPMDDLELEAQITDKDTMAMAHQAAGEQKKQERLIVMPARESAAQFDAFICYNTVDRPMVTRFWTLLRDNGILAWQDIKDLRPGDQPTPAIEKILDSVPAALVVFGPNSMGPWQEQEYYVALQRAIKRREGRPALRLIPVLLPGAPEVEDLPAFARNFSVLDLRSAGFEDHAVQPLVREILDWRRS